MRKKELPTHHYNWTNNQKLPNCALLVCLLCLIFCTCDLPSSNANDVGLRVPSPEIQEIQFTDVNQEAPLGDSPQEPFYLLLDDFKNLENKSVHLPDIVLRKIRVQSAVDSRFYALAYAGSKPTSGYSISIERIYTEGGTLFISMQETAPPPGQIVEDAHTLPFHLVSFPKTQISKQEINLVKFLDQTGEVVYSGDLDQP